VTKFVFGVVLAGVLLLSAGVEQIAIGDATATGGVCRVSNTSGHPVRGRSSFNFGNKRIAVNLPQHAKFVAVPDGRGGAWAFIQRNSWIRTKLGWFTARGTPSITGRRVDSTGRRLRADVGQLASDSDGPFYPSLLYFPTFGCWRITATAGSAHLTAIVSVTR
jgi:hypothetical protein